MNVKRKNKQITQQRQFDAVKYDRLHRKSSYSQINEDLKKSVDNLRKDAREYEKNNPYVKRYLSSMIANVIGHKGFKFSSKSINNDGSYDDIANKIIEREFLKWSYMAEVSGIDLLELQKMAVVALCRDGEVLIREIKDKDVNKYGYALQILDVARINTRLNQDLKNGNTIINGVELNEYNKPVAYHLLTDIKHEDASGHSIRIDASEIIHAYKKTTAEQVRGYTELAPVMIHLNHLKEFEKAALIAARSGASQMGVYVNDGTGNPDFLSQNNEIEENASFFTDFEPGQIAVTPKGYRLEAFNPSYPSQIYKDYVKSVLRTIAAGLNVSYNSLANDLESTSYSSIRAGVIEEREHLKIIQSIIESRIMNRVYESWIEQALSNGAISFGEYTIPLSKLEKFTTNYTFAPKRWSWVDPQKDVTASILAVNSGFSSITDVLEEKGEDFMDMVMKIKREREILKANSITLSEVSIESLVELQQQTEQQNQ